MSLYWKIAAMYGATAVVAGSFGAHGLKNKVPESDLQIWDTAVKYQIYHSLAILLTVMNGGPNAHIPCALFTAGTTIFSGSLFGLVLTGNRKLGAVTPIGGLGLIGGWLALAFM